MHRDKINSFKINPKYMRKTMLYSICWVQQGGRIKGNHEKAIELFENAIEKGKQVALARLDEAVDI